LRKGAIVPDVSMVRETVPNVAQTTFFDVLLDGIEKLLFANLHLGVGPSRHLDDHIQYAITLISEERNVVERGHDSAVLFDINTVFCGGC
jgi:hypothetical protein